ncbi:MAG TPA: ABC transporter ATP-binding protein [Bryobacteraceae bacterium]|nr:ABC transporter ATP-binding protein [Bryobacteraceae bacterium]
MNVAVEPKQDTVVDQPANVSSDQTVEFLNVSKFYGDVLGVNRVSLTIPPGITSLVGPNGSGKTTLMNLVTGLIRPSCGNVRVLGLTPDDPERFFREIGYCAQFDSFPKGVTGRQFVEYALKLHGYPPADVRQGAHDALRRVNLLEAADRKVAGYSKGMRQRIRLAQSIAHRPSVIVLDEPLNGLDPMARAETMALFQQFGEEGLHVIISSHILHEVDQISDRVILLSYGYVVAEGKIRGVREEVKEHPMQILVRCDRPALLAARAFQLETVVEAKLVEADGHRGHGVLIRTRDADAFYLSLNRIVLEDNIRLESVAPADDDVLAVYQYLIGSEGGGE